MSPVRAEWQLACVGLWLSAAALVAGAGPGFWSCLGSTVPLRPWRTQWLSSPSRPRRSPPASGSLALGGSKRPWLLPQSCVRQVMWCGQSRRWRRALFPIIGGNWSPCPRAPACTASPTARRLERGTRKPTGSWQGPLVIAGRSPKHAERSTCRPGRRSAWTTSGPVTRGSREVIPTPLSASGVSFRSHDLSAGSSGAL